MTKTVRAAMLAALLAIPTVALAQDEGLIGVTRAVAVAEKALSGQAVEAELDTRGGRLVYEVELVRNGNLHEALIDARTGKLVSADKHRWESMWRGWFDEDSLKQTSRPLGRMLAAIEAETGGRIQEVGLESEGGRRFYEVEVATAAGVADILIDPATGKRLPPALDD